MHWKDKIPDTSNEGKEAKGFGCYPRFPTVWVRRSDDFAPQPENSGSSGHLNHHFGSHRPSVIIAELDPHHSGG